jgi:hypothetical protein
MRRLAPTPPMRQDHALCSAPKAERTMLKKFKYVWFKFQDIKNMQITVVIDS